jgi:proteasome lid subunit RPN8/RPN11
MDEQNDLSRVVPFVCIHAASEAPRECCGLIVRQHDVEHPVYIACSNAAHRAEDFVIDPRDYVRAEDTGDVIGIAHSHVYMPPAPTPADLTGIERTQLPWLIVNHPLGTWTVTRPSGYRAPLSGRRFVHGVHDCYGLVRDYYAEQGIALHDYPRTFGWWNEPEGPDLYRENFEREGFVEVPRATLREHDLILMRIRALRDNHMAVYLGGNVILHHLVAQLSRREVYQEFYQRCTTAVLRHRDLFNGATPC